MFDIGFWELVLVGVVSLLVFGPERLPKVAREVALWVRRARAMAASVRQEIDHELQLQELRQSLLEEKKKVELLSTPVRPGKKKDRVSISDPNETDEKEPASKHRDGEL
ncbi:MULTISPECIES: Sec-independent protein translocase protein TatB [Methylocaldum]|jgi:sec-independent protein translocase protein TatB|uniref:Sec-independent protein translocase protein TatB n=1 Tax=unclassified Methylocaldum TaxID=2622260 RepID=UPI00098A5791|nr:MULTISPECIES: Sec-independent protein translocase protein TatB [unclassified Methylocaldum]MBP1152927.1 sec-independent protein translocase protein TatB [Methylocaldum sp. RMAD-M]MVF22714.1 twin-arginine translocase subunit TatB [Methylocaldum sp. BRCS4]